MIGYFDNRQESIVNYISNSKIQKILNSPAKYFSYYGENIKSEKTAAMREGEIIHEAILRPNEFEKRLVVSEFENYRTKLAQEWRDGLMRVRPDVLICTKEEIEDYKRLIGSVMSNKVVRNIIEKSTKETHGYAEDPISGAILYSRPDIVTKDGMICDLKTTISASPDRFNKDQFFNGYGMQLSFYNYVHGIITGKHTEQNAFYIVVEKEYPHITCVYTLNAQFEKMADIKIRKGIDTIQHYMNIDPMFKDKLKWPGYFEGVMELDPTYGMMAGDPDFSDLIKL